MSYGDSASEGENKRKCFKKKKKEMSCEFNTVCVGEGLRPREDFETT